MNYVIHSEGVYQVSGKPGETGYMYHLKDHLGNVRMVINSSKKVFDQNDYYPFGMLMTQKYSSGLNNKYKYNGKELQEDELNGESLDWYDYGARLYEPSIGRWMVPDAVAEFAMELSPYRYCFNNPILYFDPFGLWEKSSNGYRTDDSEDIERFFSYLQAENDLFGHDPDITNMTSFIKEEESGGIGKLSDGSHLTSEIGINRNSSGEIKPVSSDLVNVWSEVQKMQDPHSLVGEKWNEGMSKKISLDGDYYGVYASTNTYINLDNPLLMKEFSDMYFKDRKGPTMHPLSDHSFANGLFSLFGSVAAPVSNSAPYLLLASPHGAINDVKNADKRYKYNLMVRKYEFYKKYKIIK